MIESHSPELVNEIINLRTKGNIVENLLGFTYLWSDDSITSSLLKILKEKNYRLEKLLVDVITSWFQLNGYHVISNSHLTISQRQKIMNNLLRIIKSLSINEENTEFVYNLKLQIIRNSRLNPITTYPNFIMTRSADDQSGPNRIFKKRANCDKITILSDDGILNNSLDRVVDILSLSMIELFLPIVHKEFVNCQWMKSNGREAAPSIYQLIDFTNFICSRISTEILSERDEKERSFQIIKSIELAKKSLESNNYELLSAVIASLNSAPISRLKKTWDLVPKKYVAQFDLMNEIVTPLSNYSNYRSRIETIQDTTMIPILAVVLKDIAANDVLSTYNDNLININKLSKFGKIIHTIFQIQTQLPSVTEMRKTRTQENISFFNRIMNGLPLNDNYLLKLSYEREMPKDTSLITELNESFVNENNDLETVKLSDLTIGEKAKLLRQTGNKNPNQWNAMDIKLHLELWGFSVDLADQLVDKYIPNGNALFAFKPDASNLPLIGLRKALLRHVKELKDRQLLIDTYGTAFINSPSITTQCNSSSISPLSSLDSSTDTSSNGESSKFTQQYFQEKNIAEWDTIDITKWISLFGLTQYESNLKNVTGEDLLKMTDGSLNKLGVAVMGHRKSIIREVNKLKVQQSAKTIASKNAESKLPISRSRRVSIHSSQKVNLSYMHSF